MYMYIHKSYILEKIIIQWYNACISLQVKKSLGEQQN